MKRDLEMLAPSTDFPVDCAAKGNGFAIALTIILLAFAWTLGWFPGTVVEIGQIWWRSETYAHGLIVLPVFAWLVWRGRARIASAQARPAPWMAVPAFLAGLGWMLGQLVNVAAASHFFFISLLVITLFGTLGWQLSRVLLFPLLFLFFGVPIGDFMLPALMKYTADVTVWALRLSGVPVYQEGLYFIVPNGRWSVVEACSGIRYLIASLTVGALYAYLNYISLKRRLLFMLVALVLPIIANWARAYMIVMLGYLSDNRIAAGVDHLIYGWVFFGVIIFLMFWIGSRWHEVPAPNQAAIPARRAPARMAWLTLIPLLLVAPLFAMLDRSFDEPVAPPAIAVELPAAAAGWSVVEQGAVYRPFYRGRRGEAVANYRGPDGAVVTVYAAVFAAQQAGHEMVTWSNGLVTPESRNASLADSGRIEFDGQPYRSATVTAWPERIRAWQWYRLNGRQLIDDARFKLWLAADYLLGRQDVSVVVVVMNSEDGGAAAADARIAAFLQEHGVALASAVDDLGRKAR